MKDKISQETEVDRFIKKNENLMICPKCNGTCSNPDYAHLKVYISYIVLKPTPTDT